MLTVDDWVKALAETNEQREAELDDDVNPQDGLERYWLFLNGDRVRLFLALGAAFCAVLWCFLYILGVAHGVLSALLAAAAIACFVVWRAVDSRLRRYEKGGWRKRTGSPKRERVEVRVAVLLWLFIMVSVCIILPMAWRGDLR